MSWGLVIAALIAAALAYGYWDHTQRSRRLARLFADLAAKHGGAVTRASLVALPQLRFDLGARRVVVTAMATSGTLGRGSGPFMVVKLELPFDTGQKIRIERSAADLTGGANRLIDAVTPGNRPTTGDEAFDEAFRFEWSDATFASRLLDPHVRRTLLNAPLAHLDVRLEGPAISAHSDGFATSTAEIEALIDITVLWAERCEAGT
jgi:hypothetical protein